MGWERNVLKREGDQNPEVEEDGGQIAHFFARWGHIKTITPQTVPSLENLSSLLASLLSILKDLV